MESPPVPPAKKPIEFQIADTVQTATTIKSMLSDSSLLFKRCVEAAELCNRRLTYPLFLQLSCGDICQLIDASVAMMIASIVVDKPALPSIISSAPRIREETEN